MADVRVTDAGFFIFFFSSRRNSSEQIYTRAFDTLLFGKCENVSRLCDSFSNFGLEILDVKEDVGKCRIFFSTRTPHENPPPKLYILYYTFYIQIKSTVGITRTRNIILIQFRTLSRQKFIAWDSMSQ